MDIMILDAIREREHGEISGQELFGKLYEFVSTHPDQLQPTLSLLRHHRDPELQGFADEIVELIDARNDTGTSGAN